MNKKLFALAIVLVPTLTFAATDLTGVLGKIQSLVGMLVPLVMTLALIYFFYGLAKYILSANDDEKKTEGRNIMIYGVIALFVMASVWGLVALLQNTFLDPTDQIDNINAPIINLPNASTPTP